MKSRLIQLVLPVLISIGNLNAQSWSIEAQYAESCSCNVPCPCLLGLDPTYGYCRGNSVVSIIHGHYDSVSVDGLKIMFTFDLGNWTKIYVDERATKAQEDAILNILHEPGTVSFFFDGKILSVEKAPVTIESSDTTFTYFVPKSFASLRYLVGKNGKPISFQNLKGNFDADNKLCQSIDNYHKGDSTAFDYVGRHGMVSHFIASSQSSNESGRDMMMMHHQP